MGKIVKTMVFRAVVLAAMAGLLAARVECKSLPAFMCRGLLANFGHRAGDDVRGKEQLPDMGPAELVQVKFDGPDRTYNSVGPNEDTPQDAAAILRRAPRGLYVTVGTERGFIGASLAERVTGLLLVDRDPDVVHFNKMNVALLKLAENREDYWNLRLIASYDQWVRVATERGLDPASLQWIADIGAWQWWKDMVRDNIEFFAFHARPGSVNLFNDAFVGANYLYDDVLFGRIHKLAQENKIVVRVADLNDKAAITKLFNTVRASGEPVSVLDLSNAWWPTYIKRSRQVALLKGATAVGKPESVLLLTDMIKAYKGGPYLSRSFGYYGFRFYYIEGFSSLRNFVRALGEPGEPIPICRPSDLRETVSFETPHPATAAPVAP